MRALTFLAVALSFATAFALYHTSYVTRRLELRVQADERAAEKARSDIAALRAERAYLARPQRIEPLARQLGLGPTHSAQGQSGTAPKSERAGAAELRIESLIRRE